MFFFECVRYPQNQVVRPSTCPSGRCSELMGDDWLPDPARKAELLRVMTEIGAREGHVLCLSIDLGGMLVLAGNEAGLTAFETAAPPLQGRFPMRSEEHTSELQYIMRISYAVFFLKKTTHTVFLITH